MRKVDAEQGEQSKEGDDGRRCLEEGKWNGQHDVVEGAQGREGLPEERASKGERFSAQELGGDREVIGPIRANNAVSGERTSLLMTR